MRRVAQRVVNSNLEKKYHDVNGSANLGDLNSGYYIRDLTEITQGTSDASQRIGDKIKCLSQKFRVQLALAPAGDLVNYVRIILFQWHPQNITTPVPSDILQTTNPYSFYEHDRGTNFSVYFDKTYTLSSTGTSSRILNWTFRLGKKRGRGPRRFVKSTIKYTGGGSNNGGLDHLYMLAWSNDTTGAVPALGYAYRMTYTDA